MLNPSLNLNPNIFDKDAERIPTRYGYGDGVLECGKKNPNVVVLTADLAESTRVEAFREAFPERFIECGVAEQNMMGVAAGLALAGKIPFVSNYAVFVPGRCWDQLRVSVCYANANVKIAGSHAGISVGPDGATHQGLEDIALVRVLPNMTVTAPCDYEETKKCAAAFAKMKGPAYMRLARNKTPMITTKRTPFVIGRSEIFAEGADVTIAACGPLLFEALAAANELRKNNVSAEVLNCHTLKPFDQETLVASVKKTGCCVTVEEHQISGGLFGAVSETLARRHPVPIEPVGMPDCFGESGQPDELLKKYGMKAKDVMRAVRIAMKRK
jgi:transketolase